ncbi:MAG TPA: hypothetical protein VFW89_04170 [Gemmatimonadaceae bacterium]|nr:hypothetical protein [Gemmatimonadaceae bacterium]
MPANETTTTEPETTYHVTLIRGDAPRFARQVEAWRHQLVAPAPDFEPLPDVDQSARPLASGFYIDRMNHGRDKVRVIGLDANRHLVFDAELDGALCFALEAAGVFDAARDVVLDLPTRALRA